MTKKFARNIESFTCENCGAFVQGDGYTNHCYSCLWSKHVDVNPGDRKNKCQGLMKPVKITKKIDSYIITHECIKCGFQKRNKFQKNDSFQEALKIVRGTGLGK